MTPGRMIDLAVIAVMAVIFLFAFGLLLPG
jgi:hypothetical protein